MNRDSNLYTFLFATIMVFVVATVLAFTSQSLKDLQSENVRKEKMQNILATIGIVVEREKAPEIYTKYIIEELALVSDGSIDKKVDAFKLKLNLEIKKPIEQQRFPLYLAKVDSLQYYIVPLRGSGLWDAIWGYVALEGDKNTIKGAVFDHKSETPGLGAEITQDGFEDQFIGKLISKQENYNPVEVNKPGNSLNEYQVDGIIAASVSISSDLTARCESAGVPVVLFNRAQELNDHSAVTSDNFEGGKTVSRFFLAAGHERIAYIGGWEGASTHRDREAGFCAGLKEGSKQLTAYALADFSVERAKEVAREMFDKPNYPDAVFVVQDLMAFAVMDVLRDELGIKIPDEVSIVGYDDVPPAALAAYDLTTMRQRANIMVDKTVSLLLNKIDNPALVPQHIKVKSPLIIRSSAKIPKGWTS